MTKPFDDANFTPPADLTLEERREYERAVVDPLRERLLGHSDESRSYESIELDGDYPDTLIVLIFRESGRADRLLRAVAPIWTYRGVDRNESDQKLDSAPSVAASIYSSILAGDYESTDVS